MTDNVSKEQLRQYIERIEKLVEEKSAISQDIKDIYSEAASNGFDKKAMKIVIKNRATDRDKLEEERAIVELYENTING